MTCQRKRRFLTGRDARRAARSIRREGGTSMHAYRCGDCGLWHLGHPRDENGLPRGTGLRRDMLAPTGFAVFLPCPTCTARQGHQVMSLRQGGACARCGHTHAVRSRL